MKTTWILEVTLFTFLFIITGCFTPINTTFDNARLLDRGELEIQGSGSLYNYSSKLNDPIIGINRNLGAAVGYGISDRINVRLRYEFLKSGFSLNIYDEDIKLDDIHYFELGGKIRLVQDKLALSIPFGVYVNQNSSFYCIDPRLTYTYRMNDQFEASFIPKTHVLFAGKEVFAMPGISVGFGISPNLNRWAIRPEIGYDLNWVFGVGVSYYFKPQLRKNPDRS